MEGEKEEKVSIDTASKSQVRGRELSSSECSLELIIDLKNKKYKIQGLLRVTNISGKGESQLDIAAGQIQKKVKDSTEETEEYSEPILIEGKFSEDFPDVLKGTKDEIKEAPPDLQKFFKFIAGDVSNKIRWKLEKKGRH